MPYLRTLVLDNVHISFWRLDESSEEMWTLLRNLTDVSPYAERFSRIGSEKRRCEWVAARCLVHRNVGASAKVAYHATGRPFLFSPGAEAPAEISVTHAANLVAVAFSPRGHRVGIDLEGNEKKAWRVRERFLSAEELRRLSTPAEVLAAWCAKEATYKLCDVEGFRFMGDMQCGAIEKGQLRMKLPSVGKDAVVGLYEVEQLCFALSQWRKL